MIQEVYFKGPEYLRGRHYYTERKENVCTTLTDVFLVSMQATNENKI